MIEKKRVDGSESAVHSLKEQIKKMKWIDWKALFMLALAFVPGKVWRVVSAPIWVVTEYEHLARDNGYCFFKYIKYDHPEIKAYYPIKKNSADYKKIKDIGGYIEFGSFRHQCLFWGATYYIGTTKCYGFPYRRICEDIVQWNLHSFKYIFLNHGFTRGYSSIVDGNETRYDLLITCAEKDSDIIISENNQKRKIVKCIGFARHDSLQNEVNEKIKKQIVIMPTWRKWLDCR